jgi:predicted amidophosphoribosyltransferase
MIKFNPQKISGNWFEGYALDFHTLSSTFLGYDEFGHPVFDTLRSEIGELLLKLKYRSDRSVLHDIIEATIYFIKHEWGIADILDAIIPIPPSNVRRVVQPVIEIADGLSTKLDIALYRDILRKVRETPELKDIYDYHERLKLLQNNLSVANNIIGGKNILVFDDLFRSGATLNAATKVMYEEGKVARIYVLTLTKTRSLR